MQDQKLAATLDELWPMLCYLGLGFWLAWKFLLLNSGSWTSPGAREYQSISSLQDSITLSLIVNVIELISLFVCLKFVNIVERFLNSRIYVAGAGSLGALGSICIVLSGPYYLPAYTQADVEWLFFVGGGLSAVAAALLILKFAQIYGRIAPHRILIASTLSQIAVVFIYFVSVGIDFCRPIEGGPSLGEIVALVLCPFACAWLSSFKKIDVVSQETDSSLLSSTAGSRNAFESSGGGFAKIPAAFWRFAVVLFVLEFAATTAWGLSIPAQTQEAVRNDASIGMIVRLVVFVVFLLVAVRYLQSVSFDRIYLVTMVLLSAALCVLSLMNDKSRSICIVINACVMIVDFVAWCSVCCISTNGGRSPVFVNGFVLCFCLAGKSVGWAVSMLAVQGVIDAGTQIPTYIISAFLVQSCAAIIFTSKDYASLFPAAVREDLSLKRVLEDVREGRSQNEKERRWPIACRNVGERAGLSAREQEILMLLSSGRRPTEIAKQLYIAPGTVRVHVNKIYKKLDIHSQQELVHLVKTEMLRERY